ncbi:hypothetical protein BBOV_III001840 [Babesia bovis T2Bo]|uniref:Uncharacterized protein n=1 Tax=Babesia bovis TaxID=5865 RepID=A7AMG7_BABBO|nr:hypothetical protein BBOV_III001840 [Babesia bovis T2Bo]EDO07751.1 hypothetical protein BBOV_III001840 [Babesia bovis T2Bo]|eukprot:XP_001611319.1 hypothetical protein [Babesia bovis T2Bo]
MVSTGDKGDIKTPTKSCNPTISTQSTVYESVVDSTHTAESKEPVIFVDIFGDETNTQLATSSIDSSRSLGLDSQKPCESPVVTSRQHKKITFSDRVLHETKKLKQSISRTVSEDAGHVTARDDVSPSPILRRAITADHNASPLSRDVHRAVASEYAHAARSSLRMKSNEQIMQWFRNRYDSIDAAYSGRASTIAALEQLKLVTRLNAESQTDDHVTSDDLKHANEQVESLEQKATELQAELDKARSNVEELENALAVERKHNEEHIKDKMLLQQRIATYSEESKTLNESLDIIKNMHNSEIEEHEKRKAELMSRITQLQKDVTHINDNLFSCYKVVEKQKTEYNYLKRESDELKEEVKKLRRDLRRMYECNSSLKSQNMSLIEINNRIRTKTLFKDDGSATCSTRGSATTKSSYIGNDEFSLCSFFDDRPTTIPEYSCMDNASEPMSSMTKRTSTDDVRSCAIYNRSIFDEVKPNVDSSTEQPEVYTSTGALTNMYTFGDVSTAGTYRVDHSTVHSADNSTLNLSESPAGRSLVLDDLSEGSISVKNKNWLLEKVSRVSNRESLEHLREKIRLLACERDQEVDAEQ